MLKKCLVRLLLLEVVADPSVLPVPGNARSVSRGTVCKTARAPPALNGSPRVLQDLVEGRIPFLLAPPRYLGPPEERRVAVGLRVLEVGTGRARRQPHREDLCRWEAPGQTVKRFGASNSLPASAFGVPTTCDSTLCTCGRCISRPSVPRPTQLVGLCALVSQRAYRRLQPTAALDHHPRARTTFTHRHNMRCGRSSGCIR